MHSIRSNDDKRGSDKIKPNTKALVLDNDVPFLTGIDEVYFSNISSVKIDWDVVVTNPALLCKGTLV